MDFPGAVHHVYARGIEKRDIYFDDHDRDNFLGRLGSNLAKWKLRCSAWALMPNHFHLLVQSDGRSLPSFMHCLLTGYSRYFNERHQRVGHLFQNRYKSPVISNTRHCRDVVRYIHLNPVRSGIVPSVDALKEYSWTGHRRIMRGGQPEWQDITLLRAEFDGSPDGPEWIRNYYDYLMATGEGPAGSVFPNEGGWQAECDEVLLGDSPGLHQIFSGHLHRIAALHGIPVDRVLSRDRDYLVVRVRRAVLKKCRDGMEVPIAQLARWMGMKENSARYLLSSCR